jgi:hypothetical protein
MISIRIGRGNAVHAGAKVNGTIAGAACGADTSFAAGGYRETTDAVTCKRCLKTDFVKR